MDASAEFYKLSGKAIRAGLLTAEERDMICRRGTRKYGYFARHLRDLCDVLAERNPTPEISSDIQRIRDELPAGVWNAAADA